MFSGWWCGCGGVFPDQVEEEYFLFPDRVEEEYIRIYVIPDKVEEEYFRIYVGINIMCV